MISFDTQHKQRIFIMFKIKKIAIISSTLLISTAYAQDNPFHVFDPDSLGGSFTWGSDISGNGLVVVGQSATSNGTRAFRWTATDGIQNLGTINNGTTSHASATNFDGSIVVGNSNNGLTGYNEAFRWTEQTGMQGLGQLNGGNNSSATAISDSGEVIAGRARNGTTNRYEAFRWTEASGMQGLGQLNNGTFSGAHTISGDGKVIAGDADNGLTGNSEAFRWTETDGMQGLGELHNGSFSAAYAINSDGSVIAGVAENGLNGNWEAFRWTDATGMQGLGYLGNGTYSDARAISANGDIILGDTDLGAFRWTEQTGMTSIYDYLTENGVNLSGWELSNASGISANGEIMLGAGYNPDGDYLYWVAKAAENDTNTGDGGGATNNGNNQGSNGLIDSKEIAYSINDMYSLSLRSKQIAQNSLADQYFVRNDNCVNPQANPAQNYCAYISGTFTRNLGNNQYQQDGKAGYGNVGLTAKLNDKISAGVSLNLGQGRHDLRLSGSYDTDSLGASAHIAYGKDSGLSLFLAASAHDVRIDTKRVYRNGNDLTHADGKTKAKVYGTLAHAGYQFNITPTTKLHPFAEIEWIKADVNGFTEQNSGAFPMRFSEQGSSETATRLGIEVKHKLSDSVEVNASTAWGHQISHSSDRVTGTLQAIDIGSTSADYSPKKNWIELSTGVRWQAKDSLSLQGQAFGSSNSDRTRLGIRVALSKNF